MLGAVDPLGHVCQDHPVRVRQSTPWCFSSSVQLDMAICSRFLVSTVQSLEESSWPLLHMCCVLLAKLVWEVNFDNNTVMKTAMATKLTQ